LSFDRLRIFYTKKRSIVRNSVRKLSHDHGRNTLTESVCTFRGVAYRSSHDLAGIQPISEKQHRALLLEKGIFGMGTAGHLVDMEEDGEVEFSCGNIIGHSDDQDDVDFEVTVPQDSEECNTEGETEDGAENMDSVCGEGGTSMEEMSGFADKLQQLLECPLSTSHPENLILTKAKSVEKRLDQHKFDDKARRKAFKELHRNLEKERVQPTPETFDYERRLRKAATRGGNQLGMK
jgi:hypothetical protein